MVPKLVSVTVRVQDLDGIADIQDPIVVVEATSLPMEKAATGGEPIPDCKDPEGQCEAVFTWQRTRDSAQIYCGESLNELEVNFRVQDVAGFKKEVIIGTQPL